MSKHAAGQELLTAIQEVLGGGTYLSPQVAAQIGGLPAGDKPLAKLTPRQRQVLQLIAKGYRMREIANALQVSPRTVETHKYEIMRVLGFKNTADLVRYATWLGLVNT